MNTHVRIVRAIIALAAIASITAGFAATSPAVDPQLAQDILDTMLQIHGVQPNCVQCTLKAVCAEGRTFTASKEAYRRAFPRAALPRQRRAPVTCVRFSDGAPDPHVPDLLT